MSHFPALVITKNHPESDDGKRELFSALAPFHEFECTGLNDNHISDVDITDDMRKRYAEDEVTRLVAPDGTLHDPYNAQFYREPTEEELSKKGDLDSRIPWERSDGVRGKVRFVPEGYESKELPSSEVMTLAEYCQYDGVEVADGIPDTNGPHKFGYALLDSTGDVVKVVRRTNEDKWKFILNGEQVATAIGDAVPAGVFKRLTPIEGSEGQYSVSYHALAGDGPELQRIRIGGSRWDWYRVGGRYAGKFVDKDRLVCDIIQVGELDLESMLRCNREDLRCCWIKADADYNKKPTVVDGRALTLAEHLAHFKKVSEECYNIAKEQKRLIGDVFKEYPGSADINQTPFDLMYGIKGEWASCEEWVNSARALTTFAYIKDGEWHERGSMGWWACVSDEKDGDAWQAQVDAMIASLSPDDWLTCVDCHI